MTVDGVTVYDSSHGPLSPIRENSHSLNVVVPGYRVLVIRFQPKNPYYRTVFIEWMRPLRSHFELIEAERFIAIHHSHVEYPSSVVLMCAGETLVLPPILDTTLLQGASISYDILYDPPFNMTVYPQSGLLTASPVFHGRYYCD